MSDYVKGCLYSVLSAVIFGCLPMLAKTIYAAGMTPVSLIMFQNLMAVPILFTLVRLRGVSFGVKPFELKKLIVMSLVGGTATPMLLYSSYNYIASGTATTLHFVYPLFVLIGGVLLFKAKVSLTQGICVALCTLGVLLFYDKAGSASLFGQFIAVLSGVTYAALMIFVDKSGVASIYPFKRSMYVCMFNAALMFTVAILTGQFTKPGRPEVWLLCLGFGVAHSTIATVLFQMGIIIVGAQRAAIISTFEPIASIVIGILVYKEAFTAKIAFGSVLVLFASSFLAISGVKKSGKNVPRAMKLPGGEGSRAVLHK